MDPILNLVIDVLRSEVSDEDDGQVEQVGHVMRVTIPEKVGRNVTELQRDAFLTQNLLDIGKTLKINKTLQISVLPDPSSSKCF